MPWVAPTSRAKARHSCEGSTRQTDGHRLVVSAIPSRGSNVIGSGVEPTSQLQWCYPVDGRRPDAGRLLMPSRRSCDQRGCRRVARAA
jgi:hypothetical protein